MLLVFFFSFFPFLSFLFFLSFSFSSSYFSFPSLILRLFASCCRDHTRAVAINAPALGTSMMSKFGLTSWVMRTPRPVLKETEPKNHCARSCRKLRGSCPRAVVQVDQCPPETFPEFAVIGRSNVGKSSLINMLTGQKGLAMVSKTPGGWCTAFVDLLLACMPTIQATLQ